MYIAATLFANLLVSWFGLIALYPGSSLMVAAGTYAIGLVMLARNIGQDLIGRIPIAILILIGAALSWWLASPALAIASGATFLVSETVDMIVYSPLRNKGWNRAVVIAVVISALVDSTLFLYLAGLPFGIDSIAGQWIGKVAVTVGAVIITNIIPALRRTAQRPLEA